MCFWYHSCQFLIYLFVSGITHKSHDRKRKCIKHLSIFDQRISALNTKKLLYCKIHIMVIVSDHNQIMGIMRYTGCDCTTPESESFYNSHTNLSSIFMTFYCCNLLISFVRFKELLPIFIDIADFFHDIFCNDLSLEHFDNMYPALLPRKSKIGFFKAKKMNCVFELR